VAGGLYLSDLNLSSDEEAPVQGEPAPDMTGVVDSSFNSKVEQHATTEMQATAAELNKRFASLQGEVDLLSKARTADQVRLDKLSSENAAMQEQLRALGVKPAVSGGEPAPVPPSPHRVRKGAAARKLSAADCRSRTTADGIYPGNGAVPPPQVSYQSVPVPNQIQRKTFSYDRGKKTKSLPYIPSGSFAKSLLIEGADANASVTGNESTSPMQVRLIGRVEMPNNKTYDLTGCFVGLEAWGMSRVSVPSSVPAISAASKGIKPSTSRLTVTCPLWARTA
jgi:conjugal transfer pilus assembly protein TraB